MALRDLALTLLLLGAIPLSLVRPFIGVLFFIWLSLMNPHKLTWGFAMHQSWAQWVAIATIIGFVLTQERLLADSMKRYRWALIYLSWTAITTVVAFNFSAALPKLIEFTKTQMMCVIALSLLLTRQRIETFMIVALLSVAFYGIKGGIFTLSSGGNYLVWGPFGTVIRDNNQLAVALTMCIPLLFWLAHWVKPRWQRFAVYGALLLTAASIFGSHSRGAFLAAIAMAGFLVLKSHRKLLALGFSIVFALFAVLLMPDAYWERIYTIQDYESDGSAQGRLEMWAAAIKLANDRLTGGGFDVYRSGQFWNYVVTKARSSHSIYFQSLGEHGWPGLTMMLTFWTFIWFQCRAGIKALAGRAEQEDLVLMLRMIQVSLVGYAVGGAFVNVGYWDFPYFLAVTVIATRRYCESLDLPASARAASPRASVWARPGRPETLGPGTTGDIQPQGRSS